MEKKCSKCGIVKSLDEFHKHKRCKDGHRGQCKMCAREISRQYYRTNSKRIIEARKQYREKNPDYQKQWKSSDPDYRRQYKKRWLADNPGYSKQYYANHREEILARSKQYYIDHREKKQARNKQYHIDHREKILASHKQRYKDDPGYLRRWHRDNPEKQTEYDRCKRAHRAETIDNLTVERVAAIKSNGCWFCGTQDDLTLAHDIPVSKKGNTTIANVFCLCRSCNSSMYTKSLSETIEQLSLI